MTAIRSGLLLSRALNFLLTCTLVFPSSLAMMERSLPYIFSISKNLPISYLVHTCCLALLGREVFLSEWSNVCSMVSALTMVAMVGGASSNDRLMAAGSLVAA